MNFLLIYGSFMAIRVQKNGYSSCDTAPPAAPPNIISMTLMTYSAICFQFTFILDVFK